MGKDAVFAFPTTITSLKMIAGCGRIVAKATFGTKFTITIPKVFAWFSVP